MTGGGGKRGEGTGIEAPMKGQNLRHQRGRLEVITCRMNKECVPYKIKGHVQQMWTRCTRPCCAQSCDPAENMRQTAPLLQQTQGALDVNWLGPIDVLCFSCPLPRPRPLWRFGRSRRSDVGIRPASSANLHSFGDGLK